MARARVQPATSLVTLISDPADDTLSDEILGEAPDSNQENFAPGRPLLHNKNKSSMMANGRIRQAVTKKTVANKSRAAIARKPSKKEIIPEEDFEEEEDVDELDDMDVVEPPKTKGRYKAKGLSADPLVQTIEEPVEYKSTVQASPARRAHKVNGMSHIQPQYFHELRSDGIDEARDAEADFMIEELVQPVSYRTIQPTRARSTSQQPASIVQNRQRRAGSTSSNEGKNPDPALRRKLGEVTKKFEALEVKYRKLHDVGITEAKTNFDKLKTTSDEKARISNDLIQSLKKELAAQKDLSKKAQSQVNEVDTQKNLLLEAQAQLAAARKEISELKNEKTELKAELTEAKTLMRIHSGVDKQLNESKAQVASLTKQLSEAQREQSNLQAKLATARATSVDRQAPGSAMKGAKVPVMKVMTSTAEATAAIQEANAKIDLYSDLTGLLMQRVERRPDEGLDVFDCIQTGRNGTLHFKLSVSTDATEAYDEAEFSYLPQLDSARDKALMELLPYYLVEDIQFSRQEAAKFYSRVFEMLTRKYEDAEIDADDE